MSRSAWTSTILPRYQRRLRAVNEAIVATYLAGGNTRRIRGALQPLLKDAPLSKSAVSRVVATLKTELTAWQTRSLADVDAVYLYLDAFALRVRSAGKGGECTGPRRGRGAVRREQTLAGLGALRRRVGGSLERVPRRSAGAGSACSDALHHRRQSRAAVGEAWPRAAVQRCCVHKLRNLERKAPKHAQAEIRDDFHRIVYAASVDAARVAYAAFERTWGQRCSGVVTSLREGGDELLTFFRFPKGQWKTLRTTNVIERLHEEFRRRVKTQGALPREDAAVVLLFSLVASGQIKLRRIDGWRKIAVVLSQHTAVAA